LAGRFASASASSIGGGQGVGQKDRGSPCRAADPGTSQGRLRLFWWRHAATASTVGAAVVLPLTFKKSTIWRVLI